jgi:hypothetical protein
MKYGGGGGVREKAQLQMVNKWWGKACSSHDFLLRKKTHFYSPPKIVTIRAESVRPDLP